MASVIGSGTLPEPGLRAFAPWWPVALGLLVLYLPTYAVLAGGLWQQEAYAHGPIVLAIVLWLLWREREAFVPRAQLAAPAAGGTLIALGLALYVVGRSQSLPLFELGSKLLVLPGLVLLFQGPQALRRVRFPMLFLVFAVPLPGFLIDLITGSLKHQVSALAEQLLYWGGYPVARNGVMLTVGQYQLLVADACSGLNSMYSLSALGLMYLHLSGHANRLRDGLLFAAILPVAFVANIVRVMALVLVTYHLGDAAGQGFLHGFAGILLLLMALALLYSAELLIGLVPALRPARGAG